MRIALTVVVLLFVGALAEAKTSGWKSADDAPQASSTIQVTSHTTLVPRRHTVYQANTAAANSGFNTQQLQQGFQAADQWIQTASNQPQRTIGGELYKGVDNLAKGTTQVLQNAGEAIQGTGQNLAQTVERGLGLNQPVQPPAPAGSNKYNQWSYNYPNQQQPAAPTTATASQWANQQQPQQQTQWPLNTAATQPQVTPQPTTATNPNTWANTGWGGAQPTTVSTQPNTGWGNQVPAMPTAQSQPNGGLTAPNFNDNRWANNNDSSVLVPRGGATQPTGPSLGSPSGGALPNPQSGWPSSTPANNNTSWNNTPPANTNPASPSEVPWWQDSQWNTNTAGNSQPNNQPVATGYGDRTGTDSGNTYIPPAIGPGPNLAANPGSQDVVGSPLADSKARTAWLLLIPSFALNVYVWWSYLEIRSKYLGSLRRGGNAYAA